MTELEQQLAAYTGFLEERSLARAADHTTQTEQEQGDVIVVDLMERRSGPSRTRMVLLAAAAVMLLVVAVVGILRVGDEGARELDIVDQPDPAPREAPAEEATDADAQLEADRFDWAELDEIYNEAARTGDRGPLGGLFSSQMTATQNFLNDGAEPVPGFGHQVMVSTGSMTLNPRELSNCVLVADTTLDCDLSIGYPTLGNAAPEHVGTVTFEIADDRIVSMVETTNGADVDAALRPFFEWAAINFPDETEFIGNIPGLFYLGDDGDIELHQRIGRLYQESLDS